MAMIAMTTRSSINVKAPWPERRADDVNTEGMTGVRCRDGLTSVGKTGTRKDVRLKQTINPIMT
jgi:hypothetical protein